MRAWIRLFGGAGATRSIVRSAVEFRRSKAVDRDSRHHDDAPLLHPQAARRSHELGRSRRPLAAIVVPSIVAVFCMAISSQPASASGFRVLSRVSPSTPSAMNRACHLQTTGLDLPERRMISAVPQPSAVARMMLARHTCFCGALRSETIASSRWRSARVTLTIIPALMPRA